MSVPVLVSHTAMCPRKGFGHSDAAKRCADAVNLHVAVLGWGAVNRFVAIALADGGSDGVLYDTYEAAVTHQHGNEQRFFYLRLRPGGLPVCDAEAVIITWRKMAAAGFRTDAGRVPIPHLTIEDQRRHLRALRN